MMSSEPSRTLDLRSEDFRAAGPLVDADHGDSDGPGRVADGQVVVFVVGQHVLFEQTVVRDVVELVEQQFVAGLRDMRVPSASASRRGSRTLGGSRGRASASALLRASCPSPTACSASRAPSPASTW